MWTCPKCERIFISTNQPHSCQTVPLKKHFKDKEKAKKLFNFLFKKINKEIGSSKTISILCCVHLFGKYDFLAILPKKDKLEIRFALDRKLISPKLKTCVPMSKKVFKNCFDIYSEKEIDEQLMTWLKQSYHLKD